MPPWSQLKGEKFAKLVISYKAYEYYILMGILNKKNPLYKQQWVFEI